MFRSYNYQTFEPTKLAEKSGLSISWTGELNAASNYHCNARVLDDYFMIWVRDGCGELTSAGMTFTLQPGNLFFLFPGIMHSYKTSKKDLLELSWIGFNGFMSNPLLKKLDVHPGNPVFKPKFFDHEQLSARIDSLTSISGQSRSLELSGLLFQIFSILIENNSDTEEAVSTHEAGKGKAVARALAYLDKNYTSDVSITELAGFVNMSRSGFSRQFKKETGYSPQSYLIEIKLLQAEYLLSGNMTIKDVAQAAGFNDEYYFSRCFKKKYGISPNGFRKSSHVHPPNKNYDRTWL